MEVRSRREVIGHNQMFPPQPGTFQDREDLIKYVRDFGSSQGYVVTIKKSRRDRRVILGCDRGGVYRNRRKIDEGKRKRKASSRLINCPFEAVGKKEDDSWVLFVKNGEHNHEALKDMSEHPYSRRFTEDEVRQIKTMTEAGVKPRQVLKTLKQINPELQSTPRHLYNLKAKIRQGTLSEKSFNLWRPNRSFPLSTSTSIDGEVLKQNNQPLKVPNFIGGKFVNSQGCSVIDVINPATQEVVSQVPLSTYEEFKAAVSSAKQAFPSWKNTPITTRQHIMFKLQELIRRDLDKLVMSMTEEQGKTLKASQADMLCGLEVIERVCGMSTLHMTDFIPNISNGIDTYSIREPLGVCAGICPFNFPAISPLWIFPVAVSCGNTFILKPCEKNPGASMILAGLAMEAGLPNGVLNIVHGAHDIINYICDDEDIKALSFVSSNAAGMHINGRAASRGKRVQSNVGGKSHTIIMPDANPDTTLNALVATGFSNAGTGLSTAIFVGGSTPWEEQLVEHVKSLKVNVGTDPSADLGPVITKEAKDRICRLVHNSLESSARLLLDGREVMVQGYENGNFVGPTILCDVTTNMDCYKEEICGPVLLCMQVDILDEAIAIVNRSRFGNGASIFTASGVTARKFQNEVEAGLVGINVPVTFPWSSSSGSSSSFPTDLNICGKSGVEFYTQIKKVAQQWKDSPSLIVPSTTPLSFEKGATGRAVASALLSSSDRDSPSHGMSLGTHRASDTESPSQNDVIPVSQLSGPDRDLSSQGVSSERVYMPRDSRWNENPHHPGPQRNGIAMELNSEGVYDPVSHEIDDDDSLVAPPQRVDASSSSERMYMIPTGHLSNTVNRAFQESSTMFATSTSERMFMSAAVSQSNNKSLASGSASSSTSERMYLAPIVQRSPAAMAPAAERLYINGLSSPNLYPQSSMMSMEEFPSQGTSSQRT